jgi:predicted HicB family RNase H-like nuclease
MQRQTNRTATIGFRVEPHVKEAAERAAAKDRRSLSSLMEKILIEFLSARRLVP